MRRAVLVAVLGAAAVAVSACGGSADPFVRCKGLRTSPLTARVVAAALARHALRVTPVERSELCGRDVMVVMDNDASARQEGLLGCLLRSRPIYADAASLRRRDVPGYKTRFFLENVECSVYPRGSAGRANVRRLAAALAELKHDLRRRHG
jgi:hypothetical protein